MVILVEDSGKIIPVLRVLVAALAAGCFGGSCQSLQRLWLLVKITNYWRVLLIILVAALTAMLCPNPITSEYSHLIYRIGNPA